MPQTWHAGDLSDLRLDRRPNRYHSLRPRPSGIFGRIWQSSHDMQRRLCGAVEGRMCCADVFGSAIGDPCAATVVTCFRSISCWVRRSLGKSQVWPTPEVPLEFPVRLSSPRKVHSAVCHGPSCATLGLTPSGFVCEAWLPICSWNTPRPPSMRTSPMDHTCGIAAARLYGVA